MFQIGTLEVKIIKFVSGFESLPKTRNNKTFFDDTQQVQSFHLICILRLVFVFDEFDHFKINFFVRISMLFGFKNRRVPTNSDT